MVQDMAFNQAAYLPSITYSIILLILLFKTFDEHLMIKSKRWCIGFVFFVAYLSLFGTLNMAYQIIPLLGAIILYFLLEYWKSPFDSIQKELMTTGKMIAMIVVAVVVGFTGYRGLVAYTGFESGVDITYAKNSDLANQFVQFVLNAIGYQAGVKVFSVVGLMNAVVLFGFIAVIVCCVLLFIRYQEQPFAVKILMHFGLFVNAIHLYFIFTHY